MLSFLMKIHYENTASCTVKTKNKGSYFKATYFKIRNTTFSSDLQNCFSTRYIMQKISLTYT